MSDWKPKPRSDAKTEDMNLTGEEGFVLSRIDGSTSLKHLVAVTGLPEGRVKQIVQKLVRHGAVEGGDAQGPAPAPAPVAAARPAPRPAPPRQPEPVATVVDELSPEALRELLGEHTLDDEPIGGGATETQEIPAYVGIDDLAAADPEAQSDDDAPTGPSMPFEDGPDAAAPAPADASDGAPPPEGEGEGEAEGKPGDDVEEANHRKLYNETLSKLEPPEREALAHGAADPQLMALCFDPLPAVIRGIFENSRSGMPHARMVVRHHHTPQGLDVVMNRGEFFRDAQVQRFLLQNTMLQEAQLKKLLMSKRLADVYKISISREIPERNRQKSRHILRSKWATAEPEERASLIFTTEGRCLVQLTGLPFDSQTSNQICSKTIASNLLIQNLARFGPTPPVVLSHLLRQPAVKRQQHLRTLIKQHPNCPSEAKRNG